MPQNRTTVQIFTRAPVAGQSKTRLIPSIGAAAAAAVHRAMLGSVVEVAVSAALGPVELCCTPSDVHAEFAQLRDRYPELRTSVQQGDSLGERLAFAARAALDRSQFVIVIGSDCPGLGVSDLQAAAAHLGAGNDAVLGPAADGGYYLIGLRKFDATIFRGVSWGTEAVARQTRRNFEKAGWHWAELATRIDVDHWDDLLNYPELARMAGIDFLRTPEF